MKPSKPIHRPSLSALGLFSLAILVLFATTGCGGSGSWGSSSEEDARWRSSHRTLEAKIDRLKSQIEREQKQAERANFWRSVSVALVALVFFALVGGAALGSRARHDSHPFRSADNPDPTLPEFPDEVV